MKNILLIFALSIFAHSTQRANAATFTSSETISRLMTQSDRIIVEPANKESSLKSFPLNVLISNILMTTHLALTPRLDCSEQSKGVVSCLWMFIVESEKHSSKDLPRDEDSMTYLLFFNYQIDAEKNIHVVDNKMRYRIDQ